MSADANGTDAGAADVDVDGAAGSAAGDAYAEGTELLLMLLDQAWQSAKDARVVARLRDGPGSDLDQQICAVMSAVDLIRCQAGQAGQAGQVGQVGQAGNGVGAGAGAGEGRADLPAC